MTYTEILDGTHGFTFVQQLALEALGTYGENMEFDIDVFLDTEVVARFEFNGERYTFYVSCNGDFTYSTVPSGYVYCSAPEFVEMLGVLCG